MPDQEPSDDVNSTKSRRSGLSGLLENVLRRFSVIGHLLFLLPIAICYIFCLTTAMAIALASYDAVLSVLPELIIVKALAITLASLLFCFSLIFVVPLANLPWLLMMREYRGPWMSLGVYPWYAHNALVYLVRYTFLDFITPSPLNILFYRLMGMKIGKGCMINTSNISDPCMIELDDFVTIGGSAFLMAHYGMKGFLIIEKLKIGRKSMVGLNAKILGAVTIGANVTIGPNATAYPKTDIPDGTKFGIDQE